LIRYENLKTEGELDQVRMPLWVSRIPASGLLDLRDPGAQEDWRLDDGALIADDWTRTQHVGVQLRQRVVGIITFCAALPGHGNLTLFGARRGVDWHTRPALASTLPASRVAIGRPPPGLVELVRRLGEPQDKSLF
jgi:hypothetical protein